MISKLVLITMPFIKPTSPPLGIASLKSYVESNTNTRVKCIDINVLFHHDFISHLKKREMNKREELMASFYDFIRDKNSLDELEKLNHNITEFLEGFEEVKENADIISKDYIKGKRKELSIMDKYAQLILDEKPDMVGFSICFTENLLASLAMAKRIKELNPKTKVLFGGSFISLAYQELSKIIGRTADYIVYNQGEKAIIELVKETQIEKIPNLIYRKEDKIIENREEIYPDLNELPFADFSDFDMASYFAPFPVLPVLFSKGCYWKKCSFCVHHHSYSNTYAVKQTGRFIEELEHYNKRYGVRHFYFVDEMISSVHFERIAEAIIKSGLRVFYTALAKPTKDFSFEVLKKMHDSGCRCLLLGVESGNQRVLEMMRKGTNVDEISGFLGLSSKAGIKNCCFFILGFPSESLDELEDTKQFILSNKDHIEVVFYGRFALEKNSPIFLSPKRFGIRVMESKMSGNACGYESIDGTKIDDSVYDKTKIFLSRLNGSKQCFVYLRDIMMEYYSEHG